MTINRALSRFFTHIMHSEWSKIIPCISLLKPYIYNNQQYNRNKAKQTQEIEKNNTVLTTKNNNQMKVLKAIRVLGDVAEIIVGASIVVELVQRIRAKKKAQVTTEPTADDTNDTAETQTT